MYIWIYLIINFKIYNILIFFYIKKILLYIYKIYNMNFNRFNNNYD